MNTNEPFSNTALKGWWINPPVPLSHPDQLPQKTGKRILDLSLEPPTFGQQRITDQLALEGVSVCATSVRNVWLKENLETKYKRLLRLEEKAMGKGLKWTEPQIRLLEKANPEFTERHVQSDYPGQLLCQDTFYVGRLKGVGRIYLLAVVDTDGSIAFGKRYTSKPRLTCCTVGCCRFTRNTICRSRPS